MQVDFSLQVGSSYGFLSLKTYDGTKRAFTLSLFTLLHCLRGSKAKRVTEFGSEDVDFVRATTQMFKKDFYKL